MVYLLYVTIPFCRGAALSGLRGVARRRSVRREGCFFEASERKRKSAKPLKHLQKRG